MSDLDPQSRAISLLQELARMAPAGVARKHELVHALAREIADRDAQIVRAVEQSSALALRTDPARLFALEGAIEVLCAALKSAPGWTSCASIAAAVREEIAEHDHDQDVVDLIENELGIGLD